MKKSRRSRREMHPKVKRVWQSSLNPDILSPPDVTEGCGIPKPSTFSNIMEGYVKRSILRLDCQEAFIYTGDYESHYLRSSIHSSSVGSFISSVNPSTFPLTFWSRREKELSEGLYPSDKPFGQTAVLGDHDAKKKRIALIRFLHRACFLT